MPAERHLPVRPRVDRYSPADTVDGVTLDDTDFTIKTEENADDAGAADITVTSGADLTGFNVTAETDDGFRTQSTEVLSSSDESRSYFSRDKVDGKWVYTYTYHPPRDGDYDFELTNVTLDEQYYEPAKTTDHVVDDGTPTIDDADIAGVGQDGRTQVRVRFDEPIANDNPIDSIAAEDGTPVNRTIDDDGRDGDVVVEFNDVLQTGDGLNVSYADGTITEKFDSNDDDAAETNDREIKRTVDTVDLQLSEGQNLVSVPAETGTVSLNDLDTENVETVYAYDEGTFEDNGYAPGDETSDLENLEGGQGYVFTMSAADEIAVQAYNKPGAVEDDVVPLTDEDIEEGWNLIGHFQEAPQDRGTALMELDGATYDAASVLGEQPDGDFGAVAQFQPGDAYWVYADQSDNYARTPFSGGPVLSGLAVNGDDPADVVVNQNENIDLSIEADDVEGVDTVEFGAKDDDSTVELTYDDGAGAYTAGDVNVNTGDNTGDTVLGTITATDIVTDSSQQTVSVTIDDGNIDTTSINSPTDTTLNTDETLEVDYNAQDVNFDSAYVVIEDDSGTELANVSASEGDTTKDIDLSSNGQDVGTGTHDVLLKVNDAAGNSNTVTEADAVTVDDGNIDTASINSPADTTLNTDETLEVDYNAQDVNFDSAYVVIEDDSGEQVNVSGTKGDNAETVDLSAKNIGSGTYDVLLKVNDAAGNSDTVTKTDALTVADVDTVTAPDATADSTTATENYIASLTTNVEETVSFDLTDNSLAEADINSVTVTTGTGSVSVSDLVNGNAQATTDTNGDVTLEIEFASGVNKTDTFKVTLRSSSGSSGFTVDTTIK